MIMSVMVVVTVRTLDHFFLLYKTAQTKLATLLVTFAMLLVTFATFGMTPLLLVLSKFEQIGLQAVLIRLDFEQFRSGVLYSGFGAFAKRSQLRATPATDSQQKANKRKVWRTNILRASCPCPSSFV